VSRLRGHLDDCRALALRRLRTIPGLEIMEPQGAFYVFFGVDAYLGKTWKGKTLATSLALCKYLLEEHLLATVPGSAFGLEGWMRISFACDLASLDAALDRLERGFRALA
jgi:aspartate aminotransferase